MPLYDICRVLEQARTFCAESGLDLVSYQMHEVAAHPQAVEVLKLFQDIVSPHEKFVDPLPTTGVPFAIRDDWSRVLNGIREQGITCLFFAFHGLGNVHDRAVNRVGAYEETLLAVERAHSKGFKVGANVFVTTENVPQVDELADILDSLNIAGWWEVARYSPVSRLRRHHQFRPRLNDLLPVAERFAKLSPLNGEVWSNLEDYTESAYVPKALAHEGADFSYINRCGIRMVCRRNLDVHSGDAGLYAQLHGNLRNDDPPQVFQSALNYGPVSDDALYFAGRTLPSILQLAKTVGNARGEHIYFDAASIRYRWLDRALGLFNG
jgi:hypothetical protein